ncbi:PREDICTED: probable LRR receptor-like serine/threonine-protein kinase At4g36180 isoform X2 [Tarenaya hassleriana]|uniref:probable LRR receptor-like serine/threonine-protein kinase At4g36180 isoform X1 n=1 Tax=Tarenaya hassleriana TaxID=28532 RepID=UPI00053C10C7|nr:PREDICTED: probable LRR receptor-like serine/threonine-protein kinase At4g36180 isoform X1 [Tarenaya hassleriana]XP_010536378.1 PREDICTED: probable LRR receptor-like serine/threonine-protein kinase At4g36180 isoform X2 [Tarenaya hassleriana]
MAATVIFFLHLAAVLSAAVSGDPRRSSVTEVQALTSFKLGLRDPLGALDGWDPSSPAAPCDWRGVLCFSSGRVRELRLPRLRLRGRLSPRLAELTQLRKLSLHSNEIDGPVPSSLSRCAFLRAVYLHYNNLSEEFPPEILSLKNLQVFNVAHNSLSGNISGVTISKDLRYLDLSSNGFSGEIPANFSENSSLQLINLSYNKFSGEIPVKFGQLQELKYLWLDSNQLYGTIPSALSNCTSLVHLSAADNSLAGLIPTTLGTIPELQIVSLPGNKLTGAIPASLLCGHNSSVRIVQLGVNNFTRMATPPNAGCVNLNLEVLDLHENAINGEFPTWMTHLTSVAVLDLSDNLFSGELPREIGNLAALEELRAANNSLSGEIPTDMAKCGSLRVVDLEGNGFSGQVPGFLGQIQSLKTISLGRNGFSGRIPSGFLSLYGLETLNLSENDLVGALPPGMTRLANLTVLNLSFNRFSGEIPANLGEMKSLTVLNLSACGLTGRVPMSLGVLMSLRVLDLSRQRISGQLPIELFGLPGLQVVSLGDNMLDGVVPEGFSSLVSLQYLNLSSNSFSGKIPANYGYLRSLQALSLSHNRISGSVPSEIGNCSSLEVLELGTNRLTGHIPVSVSELSRLKNLDLSHNNITGNIPEEISKDSSLESLRLNWNSLSGRIPDSLSRLANLSVLDLSSNELNSTIPASLSRLRSLKYLNLSGNNLEGEIPQALSTRFGDPSVFADNKELCGKLLGKECESVRRRRRKKLILLLTLAAAGALLLALCCCGYVYSLWRWRNKIRSGLTREKKRSPSRTSRTSSGGTRGDDNNGNGPKLVMFNNKITLAETLEATRQFDEENVLSRGRFGLVFKATFKDGMVLSVRKLTDGSTIPDGTFRREAEALGKVKHKNVTVLRGYYFGPPDLRLLVYDYMPNGNLSTLLQEASHQDGHVLNWPMRHLIALGIARGLAFLHSLLIVHGDLKPQNVLFDADFEAHLSEFGLDKLMVLTPAEEPSTSSTPVGSLGYIAPEAALTGRTSKESDVYSFGIVLLEILTGKNPVMFTEDEDIVKWVKRQLQKGQINELLDPGLLELDPESSEWEEFLLGIKVGLLCTAGDVADRPSMSDVVFMLEGCRVGPAVSLSAANSPAAAEAS